MRLSHLVFPLLLVASAQAQDRWWSDPVETALGKAGDNKKQLVTALTKVPKQEREMMAFLIENMPERDLQRLSAEFLLENVDLTVKALAAVPWGKTIPKSIVLNDVLPYVNVSETREPWRKDFFERFLPTVKNCKTPGEAAQKLNATVFKEVGVRYSTRRRRADQSPSESIDTGMASCTGLSILLADACRAVGVPARLAGIPSWVNKRGNHTWVEIWDGGWHFTGACEPDRRGLDHTWFQGDAKLAKKDDPRHSIYAVSYKRTGTRFPMVWSRRDDSVQAVNVTERYTGEAKPAEANGKRTMRLMVRVRETARGPRVAVPVRMIDLNDVTKTLSGTSKDESNDTNDFLTFEVELNGHYAIAAGGKKVELTGDGSAQKLVDIVTGKRDAPAALVAHAAATWFLADAEHRTEFEPDPAVDAFMASNPKEAREIAWTQFKAAKLHADLRKDVANNRVRWGKYESPYTIRSVGEQPAAGWPLFIAMHGGGGVPKRINDSQWRQMRHYYRDQTQLPGGYLYVALRAPNDTWNGFYDHYVWPLVTKLIRQLVVVRDVDPNKVFLMGYSHGGYGAFAIGPNIPDRFAAIHASAAAPTPGISPAKNLRNTVFTYMIGERDTHYERLPRCRAFAKEIAKLRGDRTDIYPVTMEFIPGRGHGGLPDRDKIAAMYAHTRRATPRELTWTPTGRNVREFFWIATPDPKSGQEIDATCRDNKVTVTTEAVETVIVGLDARLVDFEKPITIAVNGETQKLEVRPSFKTLCKSMLARGDRDLAYSARVELRIGD